MFEDYFDKNLLILIICLFICLPIIAIISHTYNYYNYEMYYTYVDLDNNEGTAYECEYTDRAHFSGGMGTPICKLEDGTIIVVKQYKFIKERKRKKENKYVS